ncbi:signal recognition particle protein [Mesomycoplasma ovipneumoniae]|uniref:Signal recognition particle protein n=1 Tax=Mesomycoplasma ovipneumoniae TaxID=29562 RepID=A0AAW6Q7G6_9BACT|nr:signal recognition particle protein [Mesomycoplasma ovipneumoniae]MDF9627570.1 signal recognition particle protein [Mesomycoplasma ovipneumoniae]MDO4157702.1 signal recognition particle protein [Mesomycoplasma ovipneumoniae]MDO4158347.1 signal recognition particle protein [Mesomycoplasma ovipneumoniae]MDO6821702.1 signal recognition particle protein [Mesomycoplasma ovipneumoniae]MDO6855490.1 signal recognition particle protein [Mesomycoplasma ovipneumoniae]
MLDFLTNRIQSSLKKIQKSVTINEQDLAEIIREIRLALLEADVNLLVVKNFIAQVKNQVLTNGLTSKLNPQQEFLKILHQNLVSVLGVSAKPINFAKNPTTIMLVGLQGSGKTTTTAKLAVYARQKNFSKKILLVACDTYRPAAIDQLKQLGKQVSIDVFYIEKTPVEIAKDALIYSKNNNYDLVIFDTAGRLSINSELMTELVEIKKAVKPDQILFVLDALSGQDIINVAETFHKEINLTGSIITKLDSNARAGAALSITHLLKIPILFIGSGEKISALELFHPNRIADRILGMGDVMSLLEQAEENIDKQAVKKLSHRMFSGQFNLDDLLNSLAQIQKIGKFSKIIKMIPGLSGKINASQIDEVEQKMKLYKILISSMTLEERKKPKLLKNPSRRNRIIRGSGRTGAEFNRLINEFESMSKKMSEFSSKNINFDSFFK